MGEKNILTANIIRELVSNKKNCNVINDNGSTWLYNAIQMYNMDEKLIIDIIGYTQTNS
jgi:hypothetical protein